MEYSCKNEFREKHNCEVGGITYKIIVDIISVYYYIFHKIK